MDEAKAELVLRATGLWQSRIAGADRRVDVTESQTTPDLTLSRHDQTDVPAGVLLLDVVLGDDLILVDEVECVERRGGERTHEHSSTENRPIEREARRGIRPDDAVDA